MSYRRADAAGHAGRLYDRLKSWFDAEDVFYDLDSIESGDDFPERIRLAVSGAKVVLVLIAPDWVAEINRRAALPSVDFVRAEVELALRLNAANGIPKIIPVVLGGAAARPVSLDDLDPTLHSGLQRLIRLDVHEFQGKNSDWDRQFVRLREIIAGVPGVPAQRYRTPAGEAKVFHVIDHLLSPHFRDPTHALVRLRETLLAGGNAAIVVPATLYGMGGVGKTQLALKYTYEYRDSYAGVWWFRAEADSTLQLDARAACMESGAVLVEGESPAASFKRWLIRQEQSWLLVFDNAENAAALRPYLPAGGPHHVVITSRDSAWGGVARPIELAVWSDDEGADFLAARLPGSHRSELVQLSRALGGLQLALEQAGAFLEQTRGSVAEYRRQIDSVDTAALMLDEGRASTGYERSVLATLSLAFPRLSPAAQRLLRICAFFSAEPIPERYFREKPAEVTELWPGSVPSGLAWERVVGELRGFGIAERVDIASLDRIPGQPDESLEKALLLHRLTLEVARHALSVPAEDGPRAQLILRAYCPRETRDPKQWARFAALLPHLGSLERLSSQSWLDRRIHSWMLDRVAGYLVSGKALYQEAERLFRTAIELDKADLGDEHANTLNSMSNLASTLEDQGILTGARALKEQVLSIRRRVLGEEHPDTLTAMHNLARTLGRLGDRSGARAIQEQVLSIRRSVFGEEHPDTLTAMNNLAYTLWEQSDSIAARGLEEHVLSVRRRVLGEEHPDTLRSMNNLASTLVQQGDQAGARALQEQVLSVRRRVFGEEHPATLTAMNNLALTLRALDDPTGARLLQEQVVSGMRRVLGEEHPNTLTAMNNLALTLGELDDHTGARLLQEQVISAMRRVLGEEHPDTLTAMNNLASTLGGLDDHWGARRLQEQAVSGMRRVLGDEHPDTLTAMNNLACTLWRIGVRDEAIALMELAVQGRFLKLGMEHPSSQASSDALALWRAERNRESGSG